MKKIIGVIGAGSIGQRHVDNLKSLGHTVMVNDWIVSKSAHSYCEIVRGADALVYATPTSRHHIDLSEAIAIGKPFFMEKPVSDRLTPACKAPLMVGCNQRFNSAVIKAEKWIARIGVPIWARFTCAQLTDKSIYVRDGVTSNWGAHEIDLALHLLGPATVVQAIINPGDTIADIVMIHHNGCRTTIHLDYYTKPEIRGFLIVGSEGNLRVGLPERCVSLNTAHTTEDFIDDEQTYDDDYKEEMRAFIDRIDGNPTRGATGEDGYETLVAILDAKKKAEVR
jgi:predicted dehydrogenase